MPSLPLSERFLTKITTNMLNYIDRDRTRSIGSLRFIYRRQRDHLGHVGGLRSALTEDAFIVGFSDRVCCCRTPAASRVASRFRCVELVY